MISEGGGEGIHRKGFQNLWMPPGDGDLIKIPRTDDLGSGKRLTSSGEELVLGKDSLEEDVAHPQQGRGGATGVRILFTCYDTGGTTIQIGYLGGHPPHGQGPGEGAQAQVARRLTGQLLRRTPNGKWKYTSAAMAREEAGVLVVEEYIMRCQSTVAQYIATRSLLDLCEELERAPGA